MQCLLADPSLAAQYHAGMLKQPDIERMSRAQHLNMRVDWQVSRVLKTKTQTPYQSLSHSHGFAALLASDGIARLGVDLEHMRIRDFAAISKWICSAEEKDYLAEQQWQAEAFYRLWCIKEALLKAGNLDFPADIKQVGYHLSNYKISGLRVNQQSNWHGMTTLLQNRFALACVWRGERNRPINWRFFGKLTADDLANIHAV